MIKGDMTVAQISQKYKVHASVLHRWKKTILNQGCDLFESPLSKPSVSPAQTEGLERKIGQLTMEIDFLKKVLES
jgi:transposase-like protein